MYLLRFAEKDNKLLLSKSKYLNYLSKITKISCYILTANLIFVTISMVIFNEYFIMNLLIANNISCFCWFLLFRFTWTKIHYMVYN